MIYTSNGPVFASPNKKVSSLELSLDGVAEYIREELLARLLNAQTLNTLFCGFRCSIGVLVRIVNIMLLDGEIKVIDANGNSVPLLLDTPLDLHSLIV